jgi:hypothetical protein
MHRWLCILVLSAGVLLGPPPAPGAEGPVPADQPAVQTPYTDQERAAFEGAYADRIKNARTRDMKLALTRDLLAAAEGVGPGTRYLMLTSAKDLVTAAQDADLALDVLKRLVELKLGDRKACLAELIGLQAKQFGALITKVKTAQDKVAMEKALHSLSEEIVENAIACGNLCRADFDFDAAARAENLALNPAAAISSTKLPQLRQDIVMSQTLKGLVTSARSDEKLGNWERALWAYLDAGMFDDAARMNKGKADEDPAVLIRAARSDAAPDDVLSAAQGWDKRAVGAKDALEQIRLVRAAELYERYLAVGDKTRQEMAKARLLAIHQKLGDVLSSLRKPTEWVYLVELKPDSATVGWGAFEVFTADKGPVGIAGKNFLTGLGVHAPSKVVYSLRGQYRQFSACYGMGTGAGGAASFEVICDGKSVWKSPGMWNNHTQGVQQPVVLDIVGVDKLELVSHAVAIAGAFSRWGDPKVR